MKKLLIILWLLLIPKIGLAWQEDCENPAWACTKKRFNVTLISPNGENRVWKNVTCFSQGHVIFSFCYEGKAIVICGEVVAEEIK